MTPTKELESTCLEATTEIRNRKSKSEADMLLITGLTTLVLELIARQDRTNELLERLVATIGAGVDDGR